MKALRMIAPLALCVALLAPVADAQQRDGTLPRLSPNASTSFTVGVTNISVIYGAPSVRDRTIFGDLVPYGEVWRTGANEATAVTFSTDVIVGGQSLPAGTYGLFTVPGEDAWEVVFNLAPEQWGAYQYTDERDALRVSVTPERTDHRETLTFAFENYTSGGERDGVDLVLYWERARVPVRIETDTDVHVTRLGDRAAEDDDWRRPYTYARYALQTGRHMDRALTWADAAVARSESYATLSLRARIEAAGGDREAAAQTGERALSLAAGMEQPPQDVDVFRQEVATWREGG
jgi:hypothetical protein